MRGDSIDQPAARHGCGAAYGDAPYLLLKQEIRPDMAADTLGRRACSVLGLLEAIAAVGLGLVKRCVGPGQQGVYGRVVGPDGGQADADRAVG